MKALILVVALTFTFNLYAEGAKRVKAPSSVSLGRPIDWAAGVLEFFGIGNRHNHNCMKDGNGVFECFEDTGGRKSSGGAKFIKSSVEIQEFAAQTVEEIGERSNCPDTLEGKPKTKSMLTDFETCMLYFIQDVQEYSQDMIPLTKVYQCSRHFCEPKVLKKLRSLSSEDGVKDSTFPGAKHPADYYGCNSDSEFGEWL